MCIYLDLYPEPEGDNSLPVDLTPDVEHREDERGAQNHQTKEQRDNHKTDRVEDQHEQIVCRLSTEVTYL